MSIDEALRHALVVDAGLVAFLVGWLLLVLLRRRNAARYVVGGGAGALLFVVAVFLVVDGPVAWAALNDEVEPVGAMRVEVMAHQWAWDFRVGEVQTWNEVRVPVGVPVVFEIGSADVVHGFYVPAFKKKVDVVPGQASRLWIEPREVGDVEIGCSQHCGTNHYRMRAVVHVVPRAEFEAWQAEAEAMAKIGAAR